MEVKNLKPTVEAAKELGDSYKETAELVHGFVEGVKEVNGLYDHGYGGAGKGLISLGVAMVMFPEPTLISDVIGGGVIAAGLLYNRISPPPIFIDDIFKTIETQVRAIHDTGESLNRDYTVPLDLSQIDFDVD